MKSRLVFVYGTLKRGHGNHCVLGASKFVCDAVTTAKYILVDCGFPYLIVPEELPEAYKKPETARVGGEVYEVTDEAVMASLDRLEGVSYGHYRHLNTEVWDENDTTEDPTKLVVAYAGCDPVSLLRLTPCPIVNECYKWG